MSAPHEQPTVEAMRSVAIPADRIFAFLADLRNHWRLAGRFVEVLSLEQPEPGERAVGGRVRMRGPAGLGRTATTRVLAATPSQEIRGSARLSGGTTADVRWTLDPRDGATEVRLSATVTRIAAFDRALLALGGRRWLHRLFRGALRRLEHELGADPGAPAPVRRAEGDHASAAAPGR